MPDGSPGIWLMRQTWSPTLFVHWEVPPETVRPLLPQALHLDTWRGSAFVSLVVVDIKRARPRGLPGVPGLRAYQQLNLRTYVSHEGRSGLFFVGAWLSRALPALLQSVGVGIPSRRVSVELEQRDAHLRVCVDGSGGAERPLRLDAVVDSEPEHAREGSLEEWLHERYRAYAQRGRSLLRADVRHRPWRLAHAHLSNFDGRLGDVALPLREPTLVCVGEQAEARLLRPQRVGRARLSGRSRPFAPAHGHGT